MINSEVHNIYLDIYSTKKFYKCDTGVLFCFTQFINEKIETWREQTDIQSVTVGIQAEAL